MSKYPEFEDLMNYEANGGSKERIINSAIYHFSRDGYTKATTKAIALTAGVSEALLFKHYGNKQKLLGAVSVEIVEVRIPGLFEYRLSEVLTDVISFNESSLRQIMKDKFKYIAGNVGYFKILFIDMNNNSEQIVEQLKEKVEGFFHILESRIKKLQALGFIKKDMSARTIFRSVGGMLNFLLLDKTLLQPDLDIDEEIDAIIEMLMNGVKA